MTTDLETMPATPITDQEAEACAEASWAHRSPLPWSSVSPDAKRLFIGDSRATLERFVDLRSGKKPAKGQP